MIPDPAEITRRRVTATLVIRVIAVIAALVSLVPVAVWLAEGIAYSNFFAFHYFVANIVGFATILGAAFTLWFVAPPLARLAVPVPRVLKCPACQYRIQGVNAPQCPECGLTLTPEFLNPARGNPPAPPGHDTVLLRQIMLLVLRVVAIVGALPMTLYLLIATYIWLSEPQYTTVLIIMPPIGLLAVLALFYVFAPQVAVLSVPDRRAFERPDPLRHAAAPAIALLGLAIASAAIWLLAEGPPHPVEITLFALGVGVIAACFPVMRAVRAQTRTLSRPPESDTPA